MVPDTAADRTLRYRWIVLAILLAAYFLVYLQRNLPGAIDRTIVDDIGGIATLWSAIYFYVYAALQLPVGLMVDRVGPRKILSVALTVVTAGTFIISLADSETVLYLGKIVMSCGMASIYVPLTKVIVAWFAKRDFAKMNGYVIATGNLAGIIATAPAFMLIDSIGWRGFFVMFGIISAVLAALCITFVRNCPTDIGGAEMYDIYPEERESRRVYEKVPHREGIMTVIGSGRAFWMPAFAYFFIFGAMMLFQGRWGASFFKNIYVFDVFGLSPALVGTVLIMFLAIGKMISTATASSVAKRVGSKRKVVLSANLGFLAVWGIIWLLAGRADMFWFWASVCFMFGFCGGFMSLGYAQAKEWFPVAISATVIALFNTMVFLGGGILQTISMIVIDEKSPTLSQFTTMWGLAFLWVVMACAAAFLSRDRGTKGAIKIRT
ncbi:MAG: MFS transporter [Methanomassiliicoccaceae archaeon]|jgi:sugar phosphate permease|nr:MFS transporter [Methanomassiliicoccaceae archaeon]